MDTKTFSSIVLQSSQCTAAMAREFKRFCVIVLRSHDFKRRRLEKDRSLSQEVAGLTKMRRTRLSTKGNIALTSGKASLKALAHSLLDVQLNFFLKTTTSDCNSDIGSDFWVGQSNTHQIQTSLKLFDRTGR